MISNKERCMLLIVGINLWYNSVLAQEMLLPLRYQPALLNHVQPENNTRSAVALPFIDDFSYPGPDPDPALWINSGGNLNFSFPRDPVTYGVLTLDGLNGNGIPYDTEKPMITSGIRLGTPAGTTRGFGTGEFRQIGKLICRVLDGLAVNPNDNSMIESSVRKEVNALCRQFPIYAN